MQLKFGIYSHMISSFMWGMLMCFSAVSCTEDDKWIDSDKIPVMFSPQLSESVLPPTRVVDNKWTGGETVYIHMMDPGNNNLATSGATFNTYTVSTSSPYTNATLTPGTNQTLYYPINGDKVNFVAYSPAQDSKTVNEVTYNGFANQGTRPLMEAKDFIWCKTSGEGYNYKSTSVPLTFNHKFSKLVITVKRDASVSTTDFAKLALTVGSIPTEVKVPLNTGVPGAAIGSATLTPYRVAVNADSIVYTAIVPPHNTTRTVTFKNVTSSDLTHDITGDFKSGYSYTYNFKLAAKSVTMGNVNVNIWNAEKVAWNQDYYLSTDKLFTVDSNASSGYITVQTNAGYPTAKLLSSASWLSLGSVTKTGTTYRLAYTVIANPDMASRAVDIELSAGGVTLNTTLKQTSIIDSSYPILEIKDANCIMIPPGGSQALIPVSRVNTFAAEYNKAGYGTVPSLGSSDTFTAELLWCDAISNDIDDGGTLSAAKVLSPLSTICKVGVIGTGSSGYIYVQSGAIVGNAVVVLKNSKGTILWSWHIWVTSYVPQKNYYFTNTYSSKNYYFMDRYLGAVNSGSSSGDRAYGLYYQWGRKDPFPNARNNCNYYILQTSSYSKKSVFNTANTNATQITIADAAANPGVLYATSSNDGWCVAAQNQKISSPLRWHSNSSSNKAIDDPCPQGWKVPSYVTWYYVAYGMLTGQTISWDSTTLGLNGRYFGWWPSSKGLILNSGLNYLTADEGRTWCDGQNSNKGFVFSYGDNTATTGYFHSSHAYPIRCVIQE